MKFVFNNREMGRLKLIDVPKHRKKKRKVTKGVTGKQLMRIGRTTIASTKKAAKEVSEEAKRLRKLVKEAAELEKKRKELKRKYKKVTATPSKYALVTRKAKKRHDKR